MEHWSKRLTAALREKGWDYPELATRSGVSIENIKKYAQGSVDNPRGDVPKNIAKALGVPMTWLMHGEKKTDLNHNDDFNLGDMEFRGFPVPEYDVRASMGGGFIVDRETIKDLWNFSQAYLVNELRLNPKSLVIVEVIGDSMEPTLVSGDRVMVDTSDRRVSIPGIFVLWDGDGTVAKRLEMIPNTNPPKVMRISDNPHHGRYEVLLEDTNIVGRIVWFARRV